jgi:hypothetical protein
MKDKNYLDNFRDFLYEGSLSQKWEELPTFVKKDMLMSVDDDEGPEYAEAYVNVDWEEIPEDISDILSSYKGLNEGDEGDKVDTITMDVPLFIRLLEYAKEDAQTDMDLHNVAENAIKLGLDGGVLNMKNYNQLIG